MTSQHRIFPIKARKIWNNCHLIQSVLAVSGQLLFYFLSEGLGYMTCYYASTQTYA